MGKARWSTGWTKAAGATVVVALILAGITLASVGLTVSEADQGLDNPTPPPWWTPYAALTSLALLITSAVLFIVAAVKERRRIPEASKVDLRPLIAVREIPFTVCSECRIIIDLPYAFSCPQCDRMDCCVRVESEAERGFASAAVGPAPQ